MSNTTTTKAGADSWPWPEILTPETFVQWLSPEEAVSDNDQKTRSEIPPALLAMMRSLSDLSLAEQWGDLVGDRCRGPIPPGLILFTKDTLLDLGYRSDLVSALVAALVADSIKVQVESALWPSPPDALPLNFDPHIGALCRNVALAMLAGLTGKPDVLTITWFLECAVACGSTDAGLLQSLADAERGDAQAKRSIVNLALPYWHTLARADLLSHWNVQTDILGFPFEYATEIDDEPDVLVTRAMLLFVNGHAGDEIEAVRLAVDAAFCGSQRAWGLLCHWRLDGYDDTVLRAIELGCRLRLAGSDG